MYKSATEQVKLAYLGGAASALYTYGFSQPAIQEILMEKGASVADAEMLSKEAFGAVVKGLGYLGSKALPWVAKRLGGVAAKGGAGAVGAAGKAGIGGRLAGWGSGVARRMGSAFSAAGKGMKTDPWGTLGRGTLGVGHGMLGGGKGLGAGVGKAMLGGTVASSVLGSGGGPQNMQVGMRPQY